MFGEVTDDKLTATRRAADRSGAIVVHKGPIPSSLRPMAVRSSARKPAPGSPRRAPGMCWLERSAPCWRRGWNRWRLRRRVSGFMRRPRGLVARLSSRTTWQTRFPPSEADRMSDTIIRVAARGDGVTATGRHAAFAAPGDTLSADGTVTPGPHHQNPLAATSALRRMPAPASGRRELCRIRYRPHRLRT